MTDFVALVNYFFAAIGVFVIFWVIYVAVDNALAYFQRRRR